jgi:acyl carrier protein
MTTADQRQLTVDDALAERLRAFVDDEIALDGDVEGSTDLLLTGLVDSLGVVQIVDWIEQELDIEIDPGDVVLEHFRSVDAMVAYLRAR